MRCFRRATGTSCASVAACHECRNGDSRPPFFAGVFILLYVAFACRVDVAVYFVESEFFALMPCAIDAHVIFDVAAAR